MLNRLRWIAVSYLSSRLVLGLLLAAIAAYGFSLLSEQWRSSYVSAYPILMASARSEQVVPLVEVEDFTLRFNQDIAMLRSMPKLRRLDITTVEPDPKLIERLAGLPHLEFVVYHGFMIDDRMIRAFAKLPDLQSLVIEDDSDEYHPSKISKYGFLSLRKAPMLKTLYLGRFHFPADERLRNLAGAALPGVAILPTDRFQGFLLLCVPFLIVGVAIGVQLSRQFAIPMRRIAPRYVSSHAILAVLLAVVVAGLSAARMSRFVPGPTLAIAFSAALVSIAIAMPTSTSLGAVSRFSPRSRHLRRQRFVATLFGSLGVPLWFVLFEPSLFEWVVDKQFWWMPLVLLAATVSSIAYAVWTLSHLIEWTAGGSVPTYGAGRSPQQSLFNKMNFRGNWLATTIGRERRIERWQGRPTAWNWWNRVQRWRMGNPPNTLAPIYFLCLSSMLLAGAEVVQTIVAPGDIKLEHILLLARSLAVFMSLALALICATSVASVWRSRTKLLTHELLFPGANNGLKHEWMAAYVLDLVPAAILVAAVAAAFTPLESPQIGLLGAAVRFLVTLPIALLLMVAVSSWIVVERRRWASILFAPFALLLVGTIISVGPVSNVTEVQFLVTAFSMIIAATAAARWLRMEAA